MVQFSVSEAVAQFSMSLDRHPRHPRQPRLHPRQKGGHWLAHQLVLEGRPQTEIEEIYRYQKAVGLPITLAEVGVDVASDDQLRTIAERTVIPGESSLNEPFPVTAETLVPALRAADQLGRQRC